MAEIIIKKVKLIDELYAYIEWKEKSASEQGNTQVKDCKDTFNIPVHADLKLAFRKLPAHLAMICDEIKLKELDKVLEKYTVHSISFSGKNDEREAVVVSGGKTTVNGWVTLNTPLQRFVNGKYKSISELEHVLDECVEEVIAYIRGEKRGEHPQLGLQFNGNLSEDEDEDTQEGLEDLGNAASRGIENEQEGSTMPVEVDGGDNVNIPVIPMDGNKRKAAPKKAGRKKKENEDNTWNETDINPDA